MLRAFFLLNLTLATLSADFRAAVVKVDITPTTPQPLLGFEARTSTGVHDSIYHRVLALDDGKLQFFLVSTDIALISPSVYDDFCRELKATLNIDRHQLWWTSTHTHSAPEVGPPGLPQAFMPDRYTHPRDNTYTNFVKAKLLEAIRQARAQLAPARLALGEASSMANINRRAKDVDGKIKFGLNPNGPVDHQVGLIRIDKADGTLLAVVANYAIHGTALGPANLEISGDVPGLVALYLESKLNTTVLFVNGAAGDTAPLYSGPSFKAAHITEFNILLGDPILQALKDLPKTTSTVQLRTAETIVESPRKPGLGWTDDLAAYTTPSSNVKLPLRFLSINGEAFFWAAPVELFSEIALNIRKQSPFRYTFFCGFTNGWLGYLPTAKGFEEGGYETNTTPFTPKIEKHVTDAVLKILESWPATKKKEIPNLARYFEIPVTDLDRAIRFYEAVFEVTLDRQQIDGNLMAIFPFSEGALAKGKIYKPSRSGTLIYLSTPSIDTTLKRALALGAKTLYPKTESTPGIFVAEFQDSEGNRIALIER